jgi:hypothetical protein
VDETEIVVVRPPREGASLECGGREMVLTRTQPAPKGSLHRDFSAGTLLGKRYVSDVDEIEVLCTKSGRGSLAIDGRALRRKDFPPEPAGVRAR